MGGDLRGGLRSQPRHAGAALINRDGSPRLLSWDSGIGQADEQEVVRVELPLRQRRAEGPLKIFIALPQAASLESAGMRLRELRPAYGRAQHRPPAGRRAEKRPQPVQRPVGQPVAERVEWAAVSWIGPCIDEERSPGSQGFERWKI